MFTHQNALVQVAVAVLQADSYNARIPGLGVVDGALIRGAGGQGHEGDTASVAAKGSGEGRECRSRGDTGCGRAGVHGVERSAGGGL